MTMMVMIMTMKRMDAEDNDYEDDDEDIVNMTECVTRLKQYKGIDCDQCLS